MYIVTDKKKNYKCVKSRETVVWRFNKNRRKWNKKRINVLVYQIVSPLNGCATANKTINVNTSSIYSILQI